MITSFRERLHGGEFIIVELGALSRNSADVAAGQVLDAGTVVEFNDGNQLVSFTGDGACAGILIYPVDTREGVKAAAYIARRANVRLEGLTYPAGLAATTAAALAALTVEVRSTGLIADTGGGGGGDWILANGVWDDAAHWDDASVWKDAA